MYFLCYGLCTTYWRIHFQHFSDLDSNTKKLYCKILLENKNLREIEKIWKSCIIKIKLITVTDIHWWNRFITLYFSVTYTFLFWFFFFFQFFIFSLSSNMQKRSFAITVVLCADVFIEKKYIFVYTNYV